MYYDYFRKKIFLTPIALAFALVGCQGEDSGSEDNSPEFSVPASISAQNATFVTQRSDNYIVDLSDKVSVNGGYGFRLIDVTSLSQDLACQPLEISAQSFVILADTSKACDFEYKVAVSENTKKGVSTASLTGAPTDIAITRVAVINETASEAIEVELPAISGVTLIEQQVKINVLQELLKQTGQTVDSGFVLSETVTLPYSSNTASVDSPNHEISYTPPAGFEGIERILFSYSNATTGEVLLGTLDIAVSQTANEGLIVEDDISHEEVEINTLVTIDIAPYVTSLDGDDIQLIYVDSFNAATKPASDELTNTSFTFETSLYGNHYVSFAVTDHNGAYAYGLMELPVYDPSKSGDWDGINHQAVWFTAPHTAQSAAGEQIEYKSTLEDDSYVPTMSLALFDVNTAQNYCARVGRLPKEAELTSLATLDVKNNHNWPTAKEYLTREEDGKVKIVSISTTTASSQDYTGGDYLVTCVEGGLTAEAPSAPVVADGIEKANVTFKLTGEDKEPVSGVTINFTNTGSASLESASVSTDSEGQATAVLTSIKAESIEVCGEVGIQNTCATVEFIGDAKTAFVSEVMSDSLATWSPGDTNYFDIKVKVSDINNNPVTEVQVTKEDGTNEGTSNTMSDWMNTGLTDIDGIQTWKVQNAWETSETDRSQHTFSHTNSSSLTSDVSITLNWGAWGWTNPLEVRIVDTGAVCGDLGDDWRPITSAEVEEYRDARQNDTRFTQLAMYDPIRNALYKAAESFPAFAIIGENQENNYDMEAIRIVKNDSTEYLSLAPNSTYTSMDTSQAPLRSVGHTWYTCPRTDTYWRTYTQTAQVKHYPKPTEIHPYPVNSRPLRVSPMLNVDFSQSSTSTCDGHPSWPNGKYQVSMYKVSEFHKLPLLCVKPLSNTP
ncbi:Ig-like domain-containing protein [Vibrio campbellii]